MKKKLSIMIVVLITVFGFIPFINVYAEGEDYTMPIESRLKTEFASSSVVYLGEISVDGETQLKWIYSPDILNRRFVLGNLKANLSNTDFFDLVTVPDADSETRGLTVSTEHQSEMDTNWISASYVAQKYFTGTVGTEENGPVNNSDGHNGFLTELSVSTETSIEEIDGVQTKVNTFITYVEETKINYTKVEVTTPQIITHTVSFDANNDTDVTTQSVVSGSKVTRPSNPIKEGYEFMYWLSDTGVNIDDDITADTTFTAQWIKKFNIKQGADQTFSLESDKDIIIVADGDYDEFDGFSLFSDNHLPIDMDDLTEGKDYTIEEGSTKLTLKNSFLKTLEDDKYYVEFYFYNPTTYGDGYTDTTLLIKSANEPIAEPTIESVTEETSTTPTSNITTTTINNPKTGDNISFYFLILGFSAIALVGLGYKSKRKDN